MLFYSIFLRYFLCCIFWKLQKIISIPSKKITKMNNFPEELLKFLDDSKKHLSLNAISQFVNSYNELNENEIKFFEEHLNDCKICKENLYKKYDEEIDKAKTSYEINVNLSTKNHLNFIDKEMNIEGIISKDDGTFFLTFINLPYYLVRQNIRITFPSNDLIIRVVSAELTKKYKISTIDDINLRNNSKVSLAVKITNGKNSGLSQKNKYKYLYASAAAVLIILTVYLLIANPDQSKETKITEIEKPDLMDTDSVPVKQDTIQKIDTIKPTEQKIEIVEKKNPQPKVKISPEFKDNSYLERLVKRDEVKGIIITPEIGDTTRKQITFKWSPLEAVEYDISVVNNKNDEIWGKTLEDTRVTLYQKLDPGVYYWKIYVKGKLQAIGKFYVE